MPAIFRFVQKHRHLLVPVAFLTLIIVLVVPLPPAVMDILLSINISLAAVILLGIAAEQDAADAERRGKHGKGRLLHSLL